VANLLALLLARSRRWLPRQWPQVADLLALLLSFLLARSRRWLCSHWPQVANLLLRICWTHADGSKGAARWWCNQAKGPMLLPVLKATACQVHHQVKVDQKIPPYDREGDSCQQESPREGPAANTDGAAAPTPARYGCAVSRHDAGTSGSCTGSMRDDGEHRASVYEKTALGRCVNQKSETARLARGDGGQDRLPAA
jgi:hypothetical protein